jgi:RNA polymerase sigma factor (sigma-70 family)
MLGAPLRAENGSPLRLSPGENAAHDAPIMIPQTIIQQESVTDDTLMSRVRDGDVQALAPLFDRHHAALLNFYLRTTGNRASSEDLVQDVFVRVLKYRRTYRPGSRFLTWMYHIARHARADFLRKRRGEIEWDDAYAAPVLPGDPAESAQHRRCLALALQRLPDDKREVLVLSRFQGLRYDAIGQLLKCEPGAVKVRVHRAMRELREHFHQIAQGQIAQGQIAQGQNVKGEKL